MSDQSDKHEQLLRSAVAGDRTALNALLIRHRSRLKRLVAVRMGSALKPRVDASDIVQEVLVDAAKRLTEYSSTPRAGLYPWLRQIARQRLIDASRKHLGAERRSVYREQKDVLPLPDESAWCLAKKLTSSGTSPSNHLRRKELQTQIRFAMAQLTEYDREILIMRYLEQLSPGEIAEVLGISDRTVRARHRRALERMLELLENTGLA